MTLLRFFAVVCFLVVVILCAVDPTPDGRQLFAGIALGLALWAGEGLAGRRLP